MNLIVVVASNRLSLNSWCRTRSFPPCLGVIGSRISREKPRAIAASKSVSTFSRSWAASDYAAFFFFSVPTLTGCLTSSSLFLQPIVAQLQLHARWWKRKSSAVAWLLRSYSWTRGVEGEKALHLRSIIGQADSFVVALCADLSRASSSRWCAFQELWVFTSDSNRSVSHIALVSSIIMATVLSSQWRSQQSPRVP